MIIVAATEEVASPRCSHAFALSEEPQATERHAEAFELELESACERIGRKEEEVQSLYRT